MQDNNIARVVLRAEDFKTKQNSALVSISAGNSKMGGCPSFSTLPGNADTVRQKNGELFAVVEDENGERAAPICGTCGEHCAGCVAHCYARKMLRRTSVLLAWARNTFIKREDPAAVVRAVNGFCLQNAPRFFRVHVSGELEAGDIARIWLPVARANPETVFFGYTHNVAEYLAARRACAGNGQEWPQNLRFTLSADTLEDARALKKSAETAAAHVFVYDDGKNPELAALPHCPAVGRRGKKTGVTCAQCRRCINAPDAITACYAH